MPNIYMSLSNQKRASISYLEREGEGGETFGRTSQQADIFKVRLGLREIEVRDRDTLRKRDIETELTTTSSTTSLHLANQLLSWDFFNFVTQTD